MTSSSVSRAWFVKRWVSGVSIAIVLLAAIPSAVADTHPEARAKWMEGYQKMEAAEKTRAARNHVLALEQYQQARDIFVAVRDEYPDWNTSLLTYRINYCTEIISRLNEVIEAGKETLSREALVSLTRRQGRELEERDNELAAAQRQLRLTAEALERARREAARNAAASESVERLMEDRQQLASLNTALRNRVEQLDAQLAELQDNVGLKEATDRLQSRLQLVEAERQRLKEGVAAYEEQSGRLERALQQATVERERLRLQNEKLNTDLAQVKQAAEVWSDDNAALRRRTQNLQQELQQARDAAQTAERRAQSHEGALRQLRDDIQQLREFRNRFAAASSDLQEARHDAAEQRTRVARLQQETQNLREENNALRAQADQRRKAEAAAAAKPRDDDGQTARVRLLETQNRSLQSQLELAETLTQERLRQLADARQQAANVTRLAANLQERERQIAELQDNLEEIETRLTDRTRLLERQREVGAEQIREAGRAKDALAQATRENQNLQRRLGEMQAAALRAQSADTERGNLIGKQREQIEALTRENEALTRRESSQLAMLRRQEEEIRTLRHSLAADRPDPPDTAEAVAEPVVKEPVAPETATLDASELENLRLQLRKALTQREYAYQSVADLTEKLEAAEKELTRLTPATDAPVSTAAELQSELDRTRQDLQKKSQRVRELELALARAPTDAVLLTDQAAIDPRDGQDALLEERARQHEILVEGLLEQGVEAEQFGNIEAAVWNYNRVLRHVPDHAFALQRLGAIAAASQDHESAERYLRLAFYRDPDNLETLTQLGFTLVRLGNADLAISMLSRAVALNSEQPHAHRSLGIACSSLGWTDAAESQFRRALALDANDSDAAFNLAVLLAAKEPPEMQEAARLYQKARRLGIPADAQLDNYFGVDNDEL